MWQNNRHNWEFKQCWVGRLRAKTPNKNSRSCDSHVKRPAGLFSVLAVGSILLAACGSSTVAAKVSTTGSEQSAISYFKGKTVTLIAPDKPGGSLNSQAHIIAPYIAKYLGASVVVENIPAGHTIAGMAALEKAAPNGLTIGILDIGGYSTLKLSSGEAPLPINPADLDMLGSPLPATNAFVVQKTSPYKTFADIVNSKAPISTLLLPGTGGAMMESILQALNVNAKYITGYANATDLVAGFLRDDGTLTSSNLLNMGQIVSSGKGSAVLVTGPVPSTNTKFTGVETLDSYLSSHQVTNAKRSGEINAAEHTFFTVGASVAAPQNVPAAELSVLRAAVKFAFTQSKVGDELGALGVPAGFVGPSASAKASLAAEAGYKILSSDGIKFSK